MLHIGSWKTKNCRQLSNTLRMARQSVRLSTGRVRDHVCVSASVFDAVSPGEALMVGEQTSWFGEEFTSEQPIPQ